MKGGGSEKLKGGGKKLTFEVDEGGVGGVGEGSYKDEEGQELIEAEEEVEVVPDGGASGGGGGLVTSGGAVGGGASTKGLAKSSSTKSLDLQSREGVRRKSNPTSRRSGAGEDSNGNNKRDRSRSKSREGGKDKKITTSSGQVSVDELVEMTSGARGAGGGGGDALSTITSASPSQQLQQKQMQQLTSQPAPAQSKSQSHIQPQNSGNGGANTEPPTAKELHTHLLPHTKPPSAIIPPQVNHESISTHTKIHHTPPPPNAPITPAHSLPNSHDQPLTSRFIDFSNSQSGASTSVSPSSGGGARRSGNTGGGDGGPPATTTSFPAPNSNNPSSAPKISTELPSTARVTAAKPSRTQQKLWLQRQSSQHEPPMAIPPHAYLSQIYSNPPTHPQTHHHTHHPASASHHHSPPAPLTTSLSCVTHPARLAKEFDRVNREYLNTRRFMNPIQDSLERTAAGRNLDRRIPRRGRSADAGGNTMGLSQSLKETGSLRVGGVRGGGGVGVKDDSAVARQSVAERGRERGRERGGDLDVLLMRMWREAELLVSNE